MQGSGSGTAVRTGLDVPPFPIIRFTGSVAIDPGTLELIATSGKLPNFGSQGNPTAPDDGSAL